MPTPPPDPAGRSSSAKRVPGSGSNDPPEAGAAAASSGEALPVQSPGSTDSHHPAVDAISELLRNTGSSRRNASSDILQILTKSASNLASPPPSAPLPGIDANTDDAPTIITQNRQPNSPPPIPLIVSGDTPSIANRRLGHF